MNNTVNIRNFNYFKRLFIKKFAGEELHSEWVSLGTTNINIVRIYYGCGNYGAPSEKENLPVGTIKIT